MPSDSGQPVSVLLVTNTLARGGAESMIVRLASELDSETIHPIVICLKGPGPLADELADRRITVQSNLLKHKFDLRVIRRLSRLIEANRPACIVAVGNGGDRMFWSALAARRTGVPLIVWSHIFPTPGRRTFERVNRALYQHVDAFVALGQRHRQALIEVERIPPDRLHVIRNGIDAAAFQNADQRPQARELLGISDPETVAIAIIANFRPDKQHGLFIEAAGKVHARRPNGQFFIIGDGPERRNIARMTEPHRPYIRMLGEQRAVSTLLQGLDVVCLTSAWQECLSIVMLEAMAAGRAFVAPRIGSLDEALIDGETGRFFAPATAEALADVLIELIDDKDQRRKLGQQARAKVETEFSANTMARAFESLLLPLCKRETRNT